MHPKPVPSLRKFSAQKLANLLLNKKNYSELYKNGHASLRMMRQIETRLIESVSFMVEAVNHSSIELTFSYLGKEYDSCRDLHSKVFQYIKYDDFVDYLNQYINKKADAIINTEGVIAVYNKRVLEEAISASRIKQKTLEEQIQNLTEQVKKDIFCDPNIKNKASAISKSKIDIARRKLITKQYKIIKKCESLLDLHNDSKPSFFSIHYMQDERYVRLSSQYQDTFSAACSLSSRAGENHIFYFFAIVKLIAKNIFSQTIKVDVTRPNYIADEAQQQPDDRQSEQDEAAALRERRLQRVARLQNELRQLDNQYIEYYNELQELNNDLRNRPQNASQSREHLRLESDRMALQDSVNYWLKTRKILQNRLQNLLQALNEEPQQEVRQNEQNEAEALNEEPQQQISQQEGQAISRLQNPLQALNEEQQQIRQQEGQGTMNEERRREQNHGNLSHGAQL